MKTPVVLLPGDGLGPSISSSVVRILDAAGADIGDGVAVFEAVHGSAPDIAGRNLANPTALLCSAVLMLRHLEKNEVADRVMNAIRKTLSDGVRTGDLGGTASTTEYTEAVVARLDA